MHSNLLDRTAWLGLPRSPVACLNASAAYAQIAHLDLAHALAVRACALSPQPFAEAENLRRWLQQRLDGISVPLADLCRAAIRHPESKITATQLLNHSGPLLPADVPLLHAALLKLLQTQAELVCQSQLTEALLASADSKSLGLINVNECTLRGTVLAQYPPTLEIEQDHTFFRLPLSASQQHHSARGNIYRFTCTIPSNTKLLRVGINGVELAGSPWFGKCWQLPSYATAEKRHDATDVWVLIPVYRDVDQVRRCIDSVTSAKNKLHSRILVVDDATADAALVAYLNTLATQQQITLLRRPINAGFVGAVNSGLSYLGHGDVVLLNADTQVHGNWLDRLHAAVHSDPGIGTATALSNNAELLSMPLAMQRNATPDAAELAHIDRWLGKHGAQPPLDIPAGVGFCWYLRHELLEKIGLLDEKLIQRGYGEDTDFSLRAAKAGFRNVCATNVYVAHVGEGSFGAEKQALLATNLPRLHALYPEHSRQYDLFLKQTPLQALSRKLQRAVLAERAWKGITLQLTDKRGLDRQRWILEPHQQLLALLPLATPEGQSIRLEALAVPGLSRIDYLLPRQRRELERDLKKAQIACLEIRTFANWPLAALEMLADLGIPIDVRLEDTSAYCPRRFCLNPDGRPCSDPLAQADCQQCIAQHGALQRNISSLAAYRKATQRILLMARTVTAVNADLQDRFTRRYALPITLCAEAVARHPAPARKRKATSAPAYRRIAVMHPRSMMDGFLQLETFSRQLQLAQSPLRFVIFGEAFDEKRLACLDNIFLVGPVTDEKLLDKLVEFNCDAVANLSPADDGILQLLSARAKLPYLDFYELQSYVANQK